MVRNKIIISLIITVLLSISSAYAVSNLVYSLTLNYDGRTLTNEGLRLIEGSAPERLNQPETGFTAKIIDFKGNVLYSFKFLIETMPIREAPRDIFSENGTQIAIPNETQQIPVKTKVVLVMPYFENAKSIDIYNENNQLLLSVDVSKYSKEKGVSFDPLLIGGLIAGLFIVILIVFFIKRKPMKKRNKEKKHHKK
jgi:hypothetical protein